MTMTTGNCPRHPFLDIEGASSNTTTTNTSATTTGNASTFQENQAKPVNDTSNKKVTISLSPSPTEGEEYDKFLTNSNGSVPHFGPVEITITPVPSVPESLESHGDPGLEMGGSRRGSTTAPLTKRTLLFKAIFISGLLYLFVCSLGFLSDSFRLIAGKAAGEAMHQENNKLINIPIVGVMMGILVTVAVQSSSTSTSIVVSMVASGLFTVKTAIPIIMGANIGTSVTNTVVALTHMTNRQDFERAFGGAVLHDMFNLLTVSSLLTIEQLTGYLEKTTTKIMSLMDLNSQSHHGGEIQVLSRITKPFTSLIIQINKDVIVGWSLNDPKYDNARLLKVWCNKTQEGRNKVALRTAINYATEVGGRKIISSMEHDDASGDYNHGEKCKFLFNLFDLSDLTVGIILLLISLVLLCGCLVCLVKVLSSLLKGKLAVAVQKGVNANIPYVPCLTGYLAIGIGAVMTILVQSSSVFTSAMTPLIAMGMISLERAYPLTLGSNLGTTTTAMLAALATEGPNLRPSIQLALCHFLFNLTGILMFYPIPWMRWPIGMAKVLGRVTAKYRWFAVFYLVFMFVLLPLMVFTLSLLGQVAFYCVAGPLGTILLLTVGLNLLQSWCPQCLPPTLKNWGFLPLWLRSLDPYDRVVDRIVTTLRIYCPCNCLKAGGGVSGTAYIPGTMTGGMRPNSSQVCFVGGSGNSTRSPSPQGPLLSRNVFDNEAFVGMGGGYAYGARRTVGGRDWQTRISQI